MLRPQPGSRVAGWVFVAFGTVLGLAGFTGSDTAATVTTALAGLFFAGFGLLIATTRAVVTPEALTYRFGRVRRVPASDVTAVTLGAGSGAGYSRLVLVVHRAEGASPRLTAL